MSGQQIVEFLNQTAYGGDKLDKSLGDYHRTEVVALSRAVCDSLAKLVDNLVECHILLLHLL